MLTIFESVFDPFTISVFNADLTQNLTHDSLTRLTHSPHKTSILTAWRETESYLSWGGFDRATKAYRNWTVRIIGQWLFPNLPSFTLFQKRLQVSIEWSKLGGGRLVLNVDKLFHKNYCAKHWNTEPCEIKILDYIIWCWSCTLSLLSWAVCKLRPTLRSCLSRWDIVPKNQNIYDILGFPVAS